MKGGRERGREGEKEGDEWREGSREREVEKERRVANGEYKWKSGRKRGRKEEG